MPKYLLTWNASRTELEWAEARAGTFTTEHMVRFHWACGNTRRIQEGDRLFFLRQRMEPRGLTAIGYVEHSPYEDVHWDEERAARGERALYVDAAWEYFSVNPVISRERLRHSPFNRVYWNTQKSGISIPDEVGNVLEQEFRAAIGQQAAL
jgi:5-methylcytosine-specific restriction protein A